MLAEPEIVVEFVEDEKAEDLEKFIAEQQRLKELEAAEKKARRREISRKIAENEARKAQQTTQSVRPVLIPQFTAFHYSPTVAQELR